MSASIQRSKYTGDPGLFDFLGSVVKTGLGIASVIPGVGGIASVARNLIFPGDARVNIPGATTLPRVDVPGVIPQFPVAGPGMTYKPLTAGAGYNPFDPGQRLTTPRRISANGPCPGFTNIRIGGVCVDPLRLPIGGRPPITSLAIPDPGMAMAMNGATEFEMRAGKASGWPGYHWNKADYFLRSGEFVPAGTRSVRNRRRNPMNPRATSNAISRVKGAKRFAASLSNITIRKKC